MSFRSEVQTVSSWIWTCVSNFIFYNVNCFTNGAILDQFMYLGSSVSSTKNDFNIRLAKAGNAIERLSLLWKSDLSDKIKCNFFKQRSCHFYYMDAPRRRWLSIKRKSLTETEKECYKLYWTNPGSNIPQKSSCTATDHPSLKPFKSDERGMPDTAWKARASS